MHELFNKLTSYNLFNNLLPGVLFVVLLKQLTSYDLVQVNVVLGMFFYYFIGVVISRVGSLMIEPCLKKLHFIRMADYKLYVRACEQDPKIDVLSETNNTFRTFGALFMVLLSIRGYELIANRISWLVSHSTTAAMASLGLLFLWSYRKQTDYIRKRVEAITAKTAEAPMNPEKIALPPIVPGSDEVAAPVMTRTALGSSTESGRS